MMTYNQLSDFLKNGINSGDITEFSWNTTKNDFFKPIPEGNGIYIMFEIDQVDDRGERRIIRVGKAFRKKNGFRSRIKNNHFDGDIYNSIFRKHIAISLLNKYYKEKGNTLYNDLKDEINNFLYSKISFILLSIDDLDICNKIESGLIYLLAQEYFKQSFSTNDWLGSYSLNKEIPKYKLWNSDDTKNGHTLTQSEENYILNIKNYIKV